MREHDNHKMYVVKDEHLLPEWISGGTGYQPMMSSDAPHGPLNLEGKKTRRSGTRSIIWHQLLHQNSKESHQ